MVCIKQLSLTAAMVLSIAHVTVAAPIAIPVNNDVLDERDIEERKLFSAGKISRLIDGGNVIVDLADSIKNAVRAKQGKRALEKLEDALDQRDLEERRLSLSSLSKITDGVEKWENLVKGIDLTSKTVPVASTKCDLEELEERAFEEFVKKLYF